MAREAVGDENWGAKYDTADTNNTSWQGSIKYNPRRGQFLLLDDDQHAPRTEGGSAHGTRTLTRPELIMR